MLVLDRWSPGMLAVARQSGCSAESARDVVQDTWLSVLRNIHAFRAESSLRTWVYRILVNAARRQAARDARTVPVDTAGEESAHPTVDPSRFQGPAERWPGHWRSKPAPWTLPEDEAEAAELRTQVAAALAQLPPRQGAVIRLRDVEGLSSDEVCDVLGITAGNQRVLLHRARAAVRARLEDYLDDRNGERD